jgi:hypothetical protein
MSLRFGEARAMGQGSGMTLGAKGASPMSTRPANRRTNDCEAEHVRKDFDELAERIFRDDSPAEPLYGSILQDEPADNAA